MAVSQIVCFPFHLYTHCTVLLLTLKWKDHPPLKWNQILTTCSSLGLSQKARAAKHAWFLQKFHNLVGFYSLATWAEVIAFISIYEVVLRWNLCCPRGECVSEFFPLRVRCPPHTDEVFWQPSVMLLCFEQLLFFKNFSSPKFIFFPSLMLSPPLSFLFDSITILNPSILSPCYSWPV